MPYRRTAAVADRLERTRAAIHDAALTLVSEGGWSAVRVTAIADRAGVATGTVYRHVPDKDALCVEVFRQAADRELARVVAAAHQPGRSTERIARALRTFAERALRAPTLASALLADAAPPAVEAERRAYRQGHRDVFAQAIADGVGDGELGPCDPDIVAAALVGAMGEALLGPLAAVRADDPVPGVDELTSVCLRALPPIERAPSDEPTVPSTTASA
ncbi:TetR/AcrR family transcriptional regulator [Egibacter rhizosphaerae]|uniref:TetR/AcrR family transcriptional regulator n=1 Tax=Egibacter rhizosphaerae TaxID=1670831 RepID=A0A411YDJ3_9ACTN|nr:TetR/AcrR family transcriptional regulator [Egibacter rhizosphaerae]QBI19232.1 TetR/AcrR family transcriptional regulator [Egibacter rhizosphaerae]